MDTNSFRLSNKISLEELPGEMSLPIRRRILHQCTFLLGSLGTVKPALLLLFTSLHRVSTVVQPHFRFSLDLKDIRIQLPLLLAMYPRG